MKKGFTLIELLIVMVLVGVLVTIALPKYYVSMERGRVLEAVNNLRAASDYINARYIMDGNSYSSNKSVYMENGNIMGDFTKSVYFTKPEISSASTSAVDIQAKREKGESYTLSAHNENGELQYITCSGNSLCENIGFDKQSDGSYRMDFTK